jgi:DNA transposition AAA+ family ATPase
MTGNMGGQNAGSRVESEGNGGDMKILDPLTKELYQHKEKTGITNDDLARAIGVRTKTLQRAFNGHTKAMHPLTRASIEKYLADAKKRKNGHGK